ncbi:MAG: peptidase domain-containing ABC transporter [Pseudomonadota bacterium]
MAGRTAAVAEALNPPRTLDLRLWPRRRRVPLQLQAEAGECGLACLAMVAGFHGQGITLAELRRRECSSLRGSTLGQLAGAARRLGLATRPLRLELAELAGLRFPCVLHWDFNHFVVLERVSRRALILVDPARGRRRVGLTEASDRFTGVALELVPAANFERRRPSPELRLRQFFGALRGLWGGLLQILTLSLVLQLLALAGPYYSQLVVDEVIVSADKDLLLILALGFGALGVWRIVLGTARSWLTLYLGTRLRFGWVVRLFRQLLGLPLDYFQRRHVGDIVSRFGSISAVQALVTTASIEAVVDGVMAITTLAVMLAYSPSLTVLVLLLLALQLGVQLAFYPSTRRAQESSLVSQAAEASHFMETLRAMPTLKSFAAEGLREGRWLNRLNATINDELRVSRLGLFQGIGLQLLALVDRIGVLYCAALLVIDGGMTLGMLMAYLAYKSHFTGASQALIGCWMQFRMVSLHLERLADIVQAEPEPAGQLPVPRLAGAVQVTDLSFSYHAHDRPVLDRLSLSITPGECVAIAGPSGCGKSTLLMLLQGLLSPTAGVIRVDGFELARLRRDGYRAQVAAVMQDDQLLAGSLRDNITLFDPQPDEDRLREATRKAAMADTIDAMPMGFETLLGDLGSSLSGGERQRVLLARALYRQPSLLLLDEASSHLDAVTERAINTSLRALPMTRIVVAHRRETLAMADRIIELPGA